MNRGQRIVSAATAINLAVILLFPPFDSHSFSNPYAPIFAGFQFAFGAPPNESVNASMLFLEAAVILINASIAWLLLQDRKHAIQPRKTGYQKATLLMVAINLVLILLFPPFENYREVTLAILPSFQGFYFIFVHPPGMTLVGTLLYLEAIFVLVNGAIFWLLFRPQREVTPEEALEFLRKLNKSH